MLTQQIVGFIINSQHSIFAVSNTKERVNIQNNLKFYRQKEDLSQSSVALSAGINETHYQKIEYGATLGNRPKHHSRSAVPIPQ